MLGMLSHVYHTGTTFDFLHESWGKCSVILFICGFGNVGFHVNLMAYERTIGKLADYLFMTKYSGDLKFT